MTQMDRQRLSVTFGHREPETIAFTLPSSFCTRVIQAENVSFEDDGNVVVIKNATEKRDSEEHVGYCAIGSRQCSHEE